MKLSSTPEILAIRRSHQKLMAEALDESLPPEKVMGFIEEVDRATQELSGDEDRDFARRVVAHWSAEIGRTLASREDTPPLASPEAATAHAETAPAGSAGDPDIGGLEGLAAEAVREPPAPASVPDAREEARIKAMFRIGGLARQWRGSDASTGYLLHGAALEEARLYADDDPDIAALVMASQAAAQKSLEAQMAGERQKLNSYRLFLAFAFVALIVVGAFAYFLVDSRSELRSERDKLNEVNRTLAVQSATLLRNNNQLASQAAELDEKGKTLAVQNIALEEKGRFLEESRDRIQEILREAQPAWEALLAGDNAKIRELLTKLDALPSVDAPRAGPQRPRPQGPAAPVPTANACRGFLWLGNADDRKFTENRLLASIRPNDILSIEENAVIRLRRDMPSANYTMSEQRGVVVGGARVRVVGQPKAFERPAGTQYWAEIETALCARVFVQYAPTPAPAGKLQALLDNLRTLDVYVAPEQGLPGAQGLAEIRFFYEEDRAAANRIAATLRAGLAVAPASFSIVPLLDYPTLPTPGTIEVWIDLGRLR
jgi:hypothetical protein